MATILSRYTKETDISKSKVEYSSEKDYMRALAAGQKALPAPDFENPYNFQQWKERTYGVAPSEEYAQYHQYLREWYASRIEPNENLINELVRQDYVKLVESLKIILKDEGANKWLEDIDFNDKLTLSETIPFFARKLKEIAIYMVNKKDAIKKAKLKYNINGSTQAIEKLFYEYLLKAFTQRGHVLNIPNQEMWHTLPQLSCVKDKFQISIEELYDDTHYFDKDPNVDVNEYYDLTNPEVTAYFSEKGFPIESLEWLYQTGHTPLLADNPLIWSLGDIFNQYSVETLDELPLSAFDDINRTRLLDYYKMDMASKYLATQQYVISGGYYDVKTGTFNFPFQQGNNWFYWPVGEHTTEVLSDFYDTIALKDTNLITDGASAGLDYKTADKIFVETKDGIEAAWLKNTIISEIEENMTAQINPYQDFENGKGYKFRFPFPEYGLSAEDFPYTGPGLSNEGTLYNILPRQSKTDIQKEYWTLSLDASSIDPIDIYKTSLIDNHAHAAQYYEDADKIFVRRTPNPNKINDNAPEDGIYQETFERAWLYKFLKTDIPLKHGKNTIYWPYGPYEDKDDILFTAPTAQCVPITLSSIDIKTDMWGSRAGHGLFDSDIIYKLDSPGGYPIECAFLSGIDLDGWGNTTWTSEATGVIQPGFSTYCSPGQHRVFLWEDIDTHINETTITHKQHQLDCPYRMSKHDSIFDNRHVPLDDLGENGIGNWKDCKCKAISYSPFGHPGETYDDYNKLADVICVDTQWPDPFNLDTWRGTDGLPYDQSKDFAWFNITGNNLEKDIGWGNGYWKSGEGTDEFTFKTGTLYKYFRTQVKRDPNDIFSEAIPKLYIRHQHSSFTPSPSWMHARLLPDGSWEKTYEPSNMVFNPGDHIFYDFMDTNWYCLTSADNRPVVTTNVFDEPFDFIVGSRLTYLWPIDRIEGVDHVRDELVSVMWSITTPELIYQSALMSVNNAYSFIADEPGSYFSSATGVLLDNTHYVWNNNIPVWVTEISSVSSLAGGMDHETVYVDTINHTWNTPLYGWDYETSQFNVTAEGARPFWAQASEDNDAVTKEKGASYWGGGLRTPIDDYTFVGQPEFSEIKFDIGDAVEYRNMSNLPLMWQQPILFNTDIQTKYWAQLHLIPQTTSPLSAYLDNLDKELVISATDLPSEIDFEMKCDEYIFINYYAQEAFTWTQTLTDSSVGLPPDGGLWIEPVSALLVEPDYPYANLTNRHYPTFASMPYIGGLFEEAQVGGFFVPKGLGASVYLGKDYTTTYVQNLESPIYQDKDFFTSDYGFTNKYQSSPTIVIDTNASWMKAGITQGAKAGFVDNVKQYQEFMPYQSKFESKRVNSGGIRQLTDDYTPWKGYDDDEWIDETNFPPNWRGEYTIESWYSQFPLQGEYKMSVWKTDVFGNNYALFKSRDIPTQYDEKITAGELWVRNAQGKIMPGATALENVYNKMSIIYPELSANEIWNFDIFYDIVLFETPNYVGIQKLRFDYDTSEIFAIGDDTINIDLSGGWFAGYWYHEEEKILALCNVVLESNNPYIVLHNYSIETGTLRKIYSGIISHTIQNIEKPVFTYNNQTKTYNVTMLAHNENILCINIITENGNYIPIVTSILPI